MAQPVRALDAERTQDLGSFPLTFTNALWQATPPQKAHIQSVNNNKQQFEGVEMALWLSVHTTFRKDLGSVFSNPHQVTHSSLQLQLQGI